MTSFLKTRKSRRTTWLVIAILWMMLIFGFSATNGERSKQQSTPLTTFVYEVVGVEQTPDNFFKVEFTVRKAAHICLFAGLGAIFCGFFCEFNINKKQRLLFSVLATMAYAAFDEMHQYFVPDRTSRLYDVAIDTVGGLIGAATFLLVLFIIAAKQKEN